MSRSEAKALAEEKGAKILGSVSKKLDFLVIGNSKPTKKKIEKAKELKINIMTEENWYKLLNRCAGFSKLNFFTLIHKFIQTSFYYFVIII